MHPAQEEGRQGMRHLFILASERVALYDDPYLC